MTPNAVWVLAVLLLFHQTCSVSAYTVARNVKDYGARGDGTTDDTDAIIRALTDGRASNNLPYPNGQYPSSTQTPAYVYFPAGTYLVSQTLPVIYYTQMVGDPVNWPTIKFVSTQQVRVLESYGSWFVGGANQDNFYRQIRNFVIDMTQCARCTGVHWQVAQATSLTNIYFKCPTNTGCQGMWMENGSGGFLSDLVFEGGVYGLWVGNQQFTARNITFRNINTAVYLNWDWIWSFVGIQVINCEVGIDVNDGVGSLTVTDGVFTNVPIVIRTKFNNGAEGSVLVDNVQVGGAAIIVQNNGQNVLTTGSATTVKSWVQGHIWRDNKNTVQELDIASYTPARPASLLAPGSNKYFQMTRPNYVGLTQVDVTTLGLSGDGNKDNAAALQRALDMYAGKAVLFFPHGIYVIGSTVVVPPGSRLVGQVWSVLAASGSNFSNAHTPSPMLKIGNAGQTGVAQLVDFMISTKGPVPGAILIQWNLHDPPNAPGSNGIWDVHYRIGGAAGTGIQPGNCPNDDGSRSPASACSGAYQLLHITNSGNLYMDNVWGWVADHDIDQGAQLNVYNGRGLLVQSQGPVWGYGTAFEHSLYYNYYLNGAKNVFLGAIQTEAPYMQPTKNAPWAPTAADPVFCTNDFRCNMAYGLGINNSTDVWIYSTGLYSFFNTWSTDCVNQKPKICQYNMAFITASSRIHIYSFTTLGSVYMKNASYALAADNDDTFAATAIVDLTLF